jgi:hypothetical protein
MWDASISKLVWLLLLVSVGLLLLVMGSECVSLYRCQEGFHAFGVFDAIRN